MAAIQDALQKVDLPSLPIVATKVLQIADLPETTIRELAVLVSADVALTAKLLRLVNSSFYGQTRQINTLEKALPVLGFNALKQLCLGLSVLETMRDAVDGCQVLDGDAFWEHSFCVASAARVLAPYCKVSEPEGAFVGGLLHDLGKLLIAKHAPTKFAWTIAEAKRLDCSLYEVERREIGTTHAQIGALLADHWQLPPDLVACVQYHHGGVPRDDRHKAVYRPLVQCIVLANHLSKAIYPFASGCPKPVKASFVFERLGLTANKEQSRIDQLMRDTMAEFKTLLRA